MLPSWYIPAAFVLAILVIAIMQRVLHNEAKNDRYIPNLRRYHTATQYGVITANEWREMEENLRWERLVKAVEEARNVDFPG